MILLNDSLQGVVMAVVKGRVYKDNLMKLLLIQIPASMCSTAIILSQFYMYDSIMVTASFVFLINLIYFPIAFICLVREDSSDRYRDMIERWRSIRYPGTKTVSAYLKSENLMFSILVSTVYQIGVLALMYCEAGKLFSLAHEDLEWEKDDPFFVTQKWLDDHPSAIADYSKDDMTDKGLIFMTLFQTWAYMQIFAIFNARRPSYKDMGPFSGLSILVCVVVALLLIFQFSLCYIPMIFGFGTISEEVNLLCMIIGAISIFWFYFCKGVLFIFTGTKDEYPEQA